MKFMPVSPIYCYSGHFLEMNLIHYVSRIIVIIAWLYCLVINVSYCSSVDLFASFASMFATRLVAIMFINSNYIPD